MSKVTKAFCRPSVLIETPDYTFLGSFPEMYNDLKLLY